MVSNMRILIRHEIKKFFKSKKNLLLIGLFLVYSVIMIIFNAFQGSQYMQDTGKGYHDQGGYSSSISASMNNILEATGEFEGEDPDFTLQRVEYYAEEANHLASIGHFYGENKESDFKYINLIKSKFYSHILQGYENEWTPLEDIERQGYTLQEVEHLAQYTQHIADIDVQPMLNIYQMDGANGMVMFLKGTNLAIYMFLIAMLTVDIYLNEVMEKSYKLSFTQPFERKQIFLSKAIVVLGIAIGLMLLVAAFNFIIYTIMGGVGNWQYPMMSKESLMGVSLNSIASDLLIIPLWQYVLMGFILLTVVTIFTVLLILFTSIRTDSSNKTIGMTLIFIFLAFVLSMFLSESSIVNLLYPLSYLFTEKVLSVTNRSNYLIGILLNGIGSIILFTLSYRKFVSKDFLDPID